MIDKAYGLAALLCTSAMMGVAGQARAADDMPLGRISAPPIGYIDMCERMPAQCVQNRNASPSQLQAVRQWAGQNRWSVIFARTLGIQNPDVASRQGPTAAADPAMDAASAPMVVRASPLQIAVASIPSPLRPAISGGRWDLTQSGGAQPLRAPSPVTAPASTAPASTTAPSSPAARPSHAPQQVAAQDWRPPRFQTDLGMDRLNQINRSINRAIRATSDQAAFGKAEYWTIPQGPRAFGDCEDYVLAKRQALIEAGVPAEALSIAVVQTRRQEMHTVLLVATPDGEVVLDNLSPWILSWREAPYHWLQRQARGSALTWVMPNV